MTPIAKEHPDFHTTIRGDKHKSQDFFLKIETKAASALFETISRGERSFFQPMYIVAVKRSIVIKTLGQAFNSHWPVHMSFHLSEKGDK
jgi:hypothetical protein